MKKFRVRLQSGTTGKTFYLNSTVNVHTSLIPNVYAEDAYVFESHEEAVKAIKELLALRSTCEWYSFHIESKEFSDTPEMFLRFMEHHGFNQEQADILWNKHTYYRQAYEYLVKAIESNLDRVNVLEQRCKRQALLIKDIRRFLLPKRGWSWKESFENARAYLKAYEHKFPSSEEGEF